MPYYIILMEQGAYWLVRYHPDAGIYTKLRSHQTHKAAQDHIDELFKTPDGYDD